MTDYSDVPKANSLYLEQENVGQAITNLDAGGTIPSFMASPPPPPPYDPNNPLPPGPASPVGMAVQVTTMGMPPGAETIAAMRAWLVSRSAAIDAELLALGISDTPARRT